MFGCPHEETEGCLLAEGQRRIPVWIAGDNLDCLAGIEEFDTRALGIQRTGSTAPGQVKGFLIAPRCSQCPAELALRARGHIQRKREGWVRAGTGMRAACNEHDRDQVIHPAFKHGYRLALERVHALAFERD